MPLVTCPDCGREVSDAAPACIGCGRPMESVSAPAEPSAQQDPSSPPAWECPKCGGSELKKFSLLYEEQRSTSTSKTTAAGLGYGRGGFGAGVGRANSEGTSMTNLARRVSPPAFVAQSPAGGVIAVIILVGVAAAFLVYQVWGLLWGALTIPATLLVGVIVYGSLTPDEPDPRYRAASRRWNQSYLCLRCGRTVVCS